MIEGGAEKGLKVMCRNRTGREIRGSKTTNGFRDQNKEFGLAVEVQRQKCEEWHHLVRAATEVELCTEMWGFKCENGTQESRTLKQSRLLINRYY